MPAPIRAACLVHTPYPEPQPLPEPCDPVLLAYAEVSVSLVTFEMALAGVLFAAPGLMRLPWLAVPDQHIVVRSFNPIPDPPPPRAAVA